MLLWLLFFLHPTHDFSWLLLFLLKALHYSLYNRYLLYNPRLHMLRILHFLILYFDALLLLYLLSLFLYKHYMYMSLLPLLCMLLWLLFFLHPTHGFSWLLLFLLKALYCSLYNRYLLYNPRLHMLLTLHFLILYFDVLLLE